MPTPLSSVPMQRTGDPAGSVPVTACAETSETGDRKSLPSFLPHAGQKEKFDNPADGRERVTE